MDRKYLRPFLFFFFNDTATTEIYTLSLHDALPISTRRRATPSRPHQASTCATARGRSARGRRSEEHTSELQSLRHLVCRLLLEKKICKNACGMGVSSANYTKQPPGYKKDTE